MSSFPENIQFSELPPGLYTTSSGFSFQVLPGGELHILCGSPSWGYIAVSEAVSVVWVSDDILNEYVIPYSNRGRASISSIVNGTARGHSAHGGANALFNSPPGIIGQRIAFLAYNGLATFGTGPKAILPAIIASPGALASLGSADTPAGAQTDIHSAPAPAPAPIAAIQPYKKPFPSHEIPDTFGNIHPQLQNQPVHDDTGLDAFFAFNEASSDAIHTPTQLKLQIANLEKDLIALRQQLVQDQTRGNDSAHDQAQIGSSSIPTGTPQGQQQYPAPAAMNTDQTSGFLSVIKAASKAPEDSSHQQPASLSGQSSGKGFEMMPGLAGSQGHGWSSGDPLAHEIVSGARVAFHEDHPGEGLQGAPELKLLAEKLADRKKKMGEKRTWTLAEFEFIILNYFLWDDHKRGNISLQMARHYIVRHDKDSIDQMKGKPAELLLKFSKCKAEAAAAAAANKNGEQSAKAKGKCVAG